MPLLPSRRRSGRGWAERRRGGAESGPRQRLAGALLTAVVVGLAVFTGFKVYDVLNPPQGVAPETGQITDDDARTGVLVAAADLSQRVLTYHHDTFDQDLEVASARLTPDFREEYDSAMEQVRANTEKNKISQEATAVSSAIISATPDEAQGAGLHQPGDVVGEDQGQPAGPQPAGRRSGPRGRRLGDSGSQRARLG